MNMYKFITATFLIFQLFEVSAFARQSNLEKLTEVAKSEIEKGIGETLQNINVPGLQLDLKTFDTENNGTSYGLSYDYSLTKKNQVDFFNIKPREWHTAWSLDLNTKGNIAFQNEVNPKDFLEASLSFGGFALYSGGSDQNASVEANRELIRKAASCSTAQIENGTCISFPAFVENFANQLGLLTSVFFGLDTSFESDQNFEATQFAFGAYGAIKLFDAREDSTLGWLNVADYPFALIRNISGSARCDTGGNICFKPSGRSFPSLRMALDRVNPDGQSPRAALGDTSSFWRVNLEVAFNTPLARWNETDVNFTASYRYYREFDAVPIVKAAGLNSSELITLTIGGRDGLYVSYSSGELPFGIERDETIELGWKFNF